MLEGLRGEDSIAELCRREGIATSLYCSWSKEFLEAGKKRLAGDTARPDRDRAAVTATRRALHYVTTEKFPVAFDLESIQDLPDREPLEDAGLNAGR